MSMLDMLRELKKLLQVPVNEIREADPQLLTFPNINTTKTSHGFAQFRRFC